MTMNFRSNPRLLRACTAFLAFLAPLLVPDSEAGGAAPRSFSVRILPVEGKLLDVAVLKAAGGAPAALLCLTVRETGGGPARRFVPFGVPGLKPGPGIPVPSGAVVFDVADVLPAKGQEIVYLHPGGVFAQARVEGVFQAKAVTLLKARSFFDQPQGNALPRLRFCQDLSGDGKPDLLVPQHYGYLVAFREGEGFGRFFTLALKGQNRMVRLTHEVFQLGFMTQNCTLPALRAADFNGDGKPDLIGIRKKALVAFLGKGKGGYPLKPSFEVPLTCLATSVDAPEEDVFEGKRVFLEEINGDGLVDLVAVRTQGKVGLFSSIRTRFELFLGRRDAFYPRFPDRVLTVPGVGTRPEFLDLDGDGRKDLIVPALRTDILSGIKTVMVREVTVTYTLFAAGADGLWESGPAFRESATLPVARIEKGAAVPAAAFSGDFDGDGRRDRLVFEGKAVNIHTGVPGTKFRFSNEPRWTLEADVSNDFRVEDVNGDGASDILFFHESKVVVVLSRP